MSSEALPLLAVELDGSALDDALARALASVRVTQQLNLPALCELAFLGPPEELIGAAHLQPGTGLRIHVGRDAELLFVGEITATWHRYGAANERELRLRAYDGLHRLRKRQPVRAHVDRNLYELARELAEEVGLAIEGEDRGPVWPRIVQWRQSDLELLTETAARSGVYFALRGDALRLLTLAGYGDPVELELGRTLLEARFDAGAEPACRTVRVRGWDPWTAESHTGAAESARVGREIDYESGPDLVGAPGVRTLVDEAVHSDEHAELIAQAELDQRVAGEVTVAGTAAGDARLQPGRCVHIDGVASALEGRYVLTAAVHTIDRTSGFRTQFDTAPPPPPARARGTIATLGVVIDVDDPRKLGRVRVSLPNHCDVETDWLEVLAPGGGRSKGLVALPDVGDRVLLLLPRNDPAYGVVLGGLYGTEGPPDSGVRDERVLRYTFVTRGGQRLYLEEEDKTARLENGSGNYIELSPGRARVANSDGSYLELTREHVRVHSSVDLEIEAPGRSLTFRGARVDFQTG